MPYMGGRYFSTGYRIYVLPHWLGSQKKWVFISLHRLQIRHSKILLYFLLFFFFSDF